MSEQTTFRELIKTFASKSVYICAGGAPMRGRVLSLEGDYLRVEVEQSVLNGGAKFSHISINVPFSAVSWISNVP